jgi:hypothetical protein
LIVQWNGTSWSFVASPNTNVSQPNGLNGVTCFSASQCWAVGSYYDGTANHTLTEQWNGTSWSIVTSPNTSSTQHNYLLGVTCPSATQCWAVGEYINGANDQTLIEQWNGTSWSIATSPNTSSTQDNNLRGVTCTSATQCWAVGSYFADNGTIERTLIEQWNGSAWSIIASPNASPRSVLNGVNCTSASNCWAVGYYGTINQTLIEQWNGTAWTRIISRNLNPSGINTNYLQGINCTSASQCWAVGAYVSTNVYQTLVERWNGTSWSIVASPNISSSHGDNLANVACASASQCFTVGNYLDSALNAHPLVEQWDGTTWSIVTPPSNNTQQSVLSGVTCPSASQCWAVGYYTAGSGFSAQYQTFVIHWDGTSWSIVASPDTSTTQLNILNAVTCNSTSDCWTVGYYQNSSFIYQTLIEHWDGSAWSVVSSPNSGTQSNYFNGITCSSASDCWAAGYDGVNGSYQTLTEHWDGTSWSIVTSLNPGGSNNNVLNGVACSSASLCWAVGDYNNGSTDQNLIEVYSPSIPPLMSVGSRMTHGAAGTFDVNLPLVGTRGIECRSSATLGAGNYTVVFTFINNVTNCGSAGTTGGSVSNGPLGNQCTENLTGVPNTQYTSVTLNNVVDFENNSGNVSVPMGVLIGDTTANGAVNSSDVAQTQSQSGQPVNSTNFREDVTVNGSINSSDVALVQSKSGTALPAGVSQSQDATTPAPKHRGSPGKSF